MNILLTGGAGYIASHTLISLLESGYGAVTLDNYSNSSPEALRRVKQLTGMEFKAVEGDAQDRELLVRIIRENNIEGIIHFAGFKAVGESVEKPLMYYRNNLTSTISVIEAMLETGVRNLIFSSSATVYAGDNLMPLTESARRECINPYGWTKYMSEQIIRDAAKAHPELSCVLLRYFNPVGAHPSGLIGEDPSGIPNNLMPYICQTAVGIRDHLTVFGNDYNTPDGTGVRDYLHVCDLAEGHVKALAYALTRSGCDAVNLGTGTGYSVLDMVNAFERVNGVKVPYVIGPRRAGDLDECYADPAKAEKLLGWKAKRGINEMVCDAWNWQKKNPKGYKD
ncbi:MAG: UDP-glucose 4-epimerase GalE [Clostridiales bacterium]|nr:UDP-glucose 4-epimerase GalE [Clostridiales bacterium]